MAHQLNTEAINASMTALGGLAGSRNQFIFIAPYRCAIRSVKLVSDTATTSSSGTNKWTFQVSNQTQTLTLCSTAKTTNGSEMAEDTAYNLGVNQNLTLNAGDVLELQVTKSSSPTDLTNAVLACAVEYVISNTFGDYY